MTSNVYRTVSLQQLPCGTHTCTQIRDEEEVLLIRSGKKTLVLVN